MDLRRFSRRFQRWYFEKLNIRESKVMMDEWSCDVQYICQVYTIFIQNLVEPSNGYKSLLLGCKLPNINEQYNIFYAESNGCIFVSVKCINIRYKFILLLYHDLFKRIFVTHACSTQMYKRDDK